MGGTLSLSPRIASSLQTVEGKTTDDKVLSLLETYLAARLQACEEEITQYEIKYRATFEQFSEAWARGAVADPHSHEVERDYMEWEGLIAEKQRWLTRLRELPARHSLPEATP